MKEGNLNQKTIDTIQSFMKWEDLAVKLSAAKRCLKAYKSPSTLDLKLVSSTWVLFTTLQLYTHWTFFGNRTFVRGKERRPGTWHI